MKNWYVIKDVCTSDNPQNGPDTRMYWNQSSHSWGKLQGESYDWNDAYKIKHFMREHYIPAYVIRTVDDSIKEIR